MSSDKNSELYWAQFGFADYAKEFDKLGIKTIEQLRSRAVELERDYKLDGLCELFGIQYPVPQPKQSTQPKPVPKPKPRTNIKPILYVLGFIVAVGLILALCVRLGILKSTLTVNLTTEKPDWIQVGDARLMLISKDDDHETLFADFNDNGKASIKAAKGSYDCYILLDDWAYWQGCYEADGIHDRTAPFKADNLILRAVIVSFTDANGAPVVPQNPKVLNEDGENFGGYFIPYQDNRFLLFAVNHFGERSVTFRFDDFDDVVITRNWSAERLSELEVVLK